MAQALQTRQTIWKIEFDTEARAVPYFEAALAEALDEGTPIATIGEEEDPRWRIEIFQSGRPNQELLAKVIATIVKALGVAPPTVTLTELDERDWVAENQRSFQPTKIGRFFIYPSHHEDAIPGGAIAIRIDPGMAFGTGTHPTTRGCLEAIDLLARRRRSFDRTLDVGCGSGILALALSHFSKRRVLAVDNDPQAVEVARQNVALNKAEDRIIVNLSEGLADLSIRARAPYEIIIANILAKPLIDLASDMASYLADRGYIVLSGILTRQQEEVLDAYRSQGFTLWKALEHGEWSTLILKG